MKEPILEVNNLRVSFRTYNGKVQAVRGTILSYMRAKLWQS